jgi:hypothetical protein
VKLTPKLTPWLVGRRLGLPRRGGAIRARALGVRVDPIASDAELLGQPLSIDRPTAGREGPTTSTTRSAIACSSVTSNRTLPGGEHPLRTAVWTFMRPMLSPNLTALNRDAFVHEDSAQSTVGLERHRSDSDLAEIDLGDDPDASSGA